MKNAIYIILIFILSLSCTESDDDNFTPINIEYTLIDEGSLSGSGFENISQSNLVITNQADWETLINKMDTLNNVSSSFSETQIDFNTYTIIAIFLEVKPNGWEIEIDSIIENENEITVTTSEIEYGTLAMTQPYFIVKIENVEKPMVFN